MTGPRAPDRCTELDLDEARPSLVPGARHLLTAACITVLLVTVLCSAAVRTALSPGPAPAPVRAIAVLALSSVAAVPRPQATLELQVLNRGSSPLLVGNVRIDGAGLDPAATTADLRAAPGADAPLDLTTGLDCDSPDATITPPRALVLVRPADSAAAGWITLTAVGIGTADQSGGLCAEATAVLSSGAQPTVAVLASGFAGGVLRLVVAGLPEGAHLVSGRAGDWLLPAAPGSAGATVTGGRLVAELQQPLPGCLDTEALDVVPSGVLLVLEAPDGGLVDRYAPVGPALAAWLLDAYARVCQSR